MKAPAYADGGGDDQDARSRRNRKRRHRAPAFQKLRLSGISVDPIRSAGRRFRGWGLFSPHT
jgi:hypothetical protein